MSRNIPTRGGGYSYNNADGSRYFSNPDGSKFYDPGNSGKGRKWYESPDGVRHYMDEEPELVHQEEAAFEVDLSDSDYYGEDYDEYGNEGYENDGYGNDGYDSDDSADTILLTSDFGIFWSCVG